MDRKTGQKMDRGTDWEMDREIGRVIVRKTDHNAVLRVHQTIDRNAVPGVHQMIDRNAVPGVHQTIERRTDHIDAAGFGRRRP